jgi:hypothetical protein
MSISPTQISWTSYMEYEGPFFRGTQTFSIPENPDWTTKILAVIAATEGGKFDAYNGYDRCVCTSGLIQWCEANQYSVSDMLGVVAGRNLPDIRALDPALDASNAEFKKNARGRWRFFFRDERGEVDRLPEQQQLFLLHSSGHRNSWDNASREHAKLWAACISSVWGSPQTRRAQIDYTAPRLMGFVAEPAKTILFGPQTPAENEGFTGAVRAGYLSFAANLPAVANTHLQRALDTTKAPRFSEDWCIAVLKQLTFGPKITIYPRRYNAIRPVLERLFSVNLPDFSDELKQWTETVITRPDNPPQASVPNLTVADFDEVIEVQRELIAQRYDLGPAGADGVYGRASKNAVIHFQQLHGLTPDAILGPMTQKALLQSALKRMSE